MQSQTERAGKKTKQRKAALNTEKRAKRKKKEGVKSLENNFKILLAGMKKDSHLCNPKTKGIAESNRAAQGGTETEKRLRE